jgi:hypothetical protein
MSFFRIAAEQRDAERRKREFQEIEKALALTKRKFKQETTEVMLGVSLISRSGICRSSCSPNARIPKRTP